MKNRSAILKNKKIMFLGCIMCCFAACAPRYPERPLPDAGTGGTAGFITQENEGQAAEDGAETGQEGSQGSAQDAAESGKPGLDGAEYTEGIASIQQEEIRQMGDALMYEGCSFSLLSYEKTQTFGDRVPENLNDWFTTDADKNLTGDSYYIFLTLCITNEGDVPVQVHRTHGELAAVQENMEYVTVGEPCYVDEEYTGGAPSSVWAWKFEPGESITCEVGYIVEGEYLGDSPYSLYYKFTASENEEFADRFIKLE